MSYPLGHERREAERLEAQAQLLRDENLERLAVPGARMLEIGCGTGSNYPHVARADYHGVDSAPEAIALARARHGERFTVGDATALPFADATFDVVFTKLVLWSIPDWRKVLREALRVLRPGGRLHTFELDDAFVLFEPPRPAFQKRIAEWDARAVDAGLDPFIGRKVPAAMREAGFVDVRARFEPRLALAGSPEHAAVLANLHDFYFGASALRYGLAGDPAAEREATRSDAYGLVMDSFFVATATRAFSS